MSTTTPSALSPVPTTKILAIGKFTAQPSSSDLKEIMPDEVSDTARLYLEGKIDQWYSRQDQAGVVFLLNANDVEEAHNLLEGLPLGRAGLMTFEFVPLGPLKPLRFLLAAPAQQDRETQAGAPSDERSVNLATAHDRTRPTDIRI